VNFNDWLLDRITSGSMKITHPLNMPITVHDSCYSKAYGEPCWEKHRKILSCCGCDILEMEHNRADSLCCGFGKGASWTKNFTIPYEIIASGAKKFREAEKTGARALVSYCGGCIYLLWAARELLGSKIDVYHNLEVVRMAMGEKLNYPQDHIRRAWDVIAIISYQLMVSMPQRNFTIGELSYDEARSTFKPGDLRLLKGIRSLLEFPIIRKAYAGMFRALMPLLASGTVR
jgi:hypothetical protein